MKISIVYLDINTGYFPGLHHGLAYLLGYIRRNGYNAKFYHITSETLFAELYEKLEDVDILGISFVTNQLRYFKDFLSGIPPTFKGKLIAGGVHSTLMYEEVLQEFNQIDGVCVGEGEIAFYNYIRAIEKGEDPKQVEGFAFLERDGSITFNKLSAFATMEEIGFPDYTIFDYKNIVSHSANTFPMMLSRGCPFLCSYCSNHALRKVYNTSAGYVRLPNVDYTIKCIKNNLKLYPETKCISFADDTFTLNKKWIAEFSIKYKKEISIPFDCNARVETVNDDLLQNLKNAGCITLHFGVESGSEWLRKNILNRKQSNEEIIQAFQLSSHYGLKTTSSTMTGLPFETQEMFEQTFSLIRQTRPNFGSCFFFFPYPKTVLWEISQRYNLLESDIESISGYLEKPSVKPIFISNSQIKDNFSKLKFYFMLRIFFTRISAPEFVESFFLLIIIPPLRRWIVKFMTGRSRLKYLIRKLGYAVKR